MSKIGQKLALLLCLFLLGGCQKKIPEKTEVLIIGAGLSGLSAGHLLKKEGIPFKIVELTTRAGGRLKTVHYGDTVVEAGLAEFWSDNGILQFIKDFKIPVEKEVAYSSVILNGKLHPFVHETSEEFLSSLFSETEIKSLRRWEERVKEVYNSIQKGDSNQELSTLKGISFAKWVANSELSPRVQNWIRITVEIEIATGWDLISALDGIDEWMTFVEGGETAHRIVGGNDRLIQALVRSIGEKNIIFDTRVTGIQQLEDRIIVTTVQNEGQSVVKIEANNVISTIPLFRLFEVQFDPELPREIQEAIGTQTWGSYFSAHVFLKPTAERFWTVDGETTLGILSDGPLGFVYDGNPYDENPKVRVLNFLSSGASAEAFNLQPLSQVRQELEKSLEALFPGIGQEILSWEFFRYHPRAIASWPVGRSRFDKLSEAVRRPIGRLYLAGDFTENTHSDGAVRSAFRVVKDIIEKKHHAFGSPAD
ncbi:MAG: FAD-dependent oxidoreductase [Deltaproteobacteria bacterium]|nr:FAD-dependent oxidoreductase [Deltaproteobacteria bacterium]